jgi:hypothetical protein
VIEPEDEEWIDPVADGLDGHAGAARTLGFVKDDNRQVSLAEFERLLAARPTADASQPAGLIGRLRAWVG